MWGGAAHWDSIAAGVNRMAAASAKGTTLHIAHQGWNDTGNGAQVCTSFRFAGLRNTT